jgi:hypothetical protein
LECLQSADPSFGKTTTNAGALGLFRAPAHTVVDDSKAVNLLKNNFPERHGKIAGN